MGERLSTAVSLIFGNAQLTLPEKGSPKETSMRIYQALLAPHPFGQRDLAALQVEASWSTTPAGPGKMGLNMTL